MNLLHDSSANPEPPKALAHATVTISGDGVKPDFWTDYFRVEPDISVVKGMPFKTPSGRISRNPGRSGVWGCVSRRSIRDDALDPHIAFLIARLGLPRSDLSDKLAACGGELRFLCYWSNYTGNRIPHIDPRLRQIVGAIPGEIQIDEFPQKITMIDKEGNASEVWV